jgi:Beta-lactamase superfamily domain
MQKTPTIVCFQVTPVLLLLFQLLFVPKRGLTRGKNKNGSLSMAKLTWLGHACWKLEGDDGFVVLFDPWLGNPLAPEGSKSPSDHARVDAVVISHGHFDHVGDVVAIAKEHSGCKIVCQHEITMFLGAQGVSADQLVGMNKGGTVPLSDKEEFKGWKATMTDAVHSSGCPAVKEGEAAQVGGEAAGFIVHTPGDNGHRIYHTGLFCFVSLRKSSCVGDNSSCRWADNVPLPLTRELTFAFASKSLQGTPTPSPP